MKVKVRSFHGLRRVNARALHVLSLVSFVAVMMAGTPAKAEAHKTQDDCMTANRIYGDDPGRWNGAESALSDACEKYPSTNKPSAAASSTTSGSSTSAQKAACEDAWGLASKVCLKPETTLGVMMVGNVGASLMSMMKDSSGTAETCKNQSTIGGIMALLNGGWAAACGTLTYKCESACGKPEGQKDASPVNAEHLAECKSYYQSAMLLAGMAVQFGAFTAQAKNCEKAASLADSQCLTPESMQRPECKDYCLRNPTSPICAKTDCTDPAQQQSNPACLAFKTPTGTGNTGDPGAFGSGGNSYSSKSPGSFNDGLGDMLDGNQFKPSGPINSATNNRGVSGGGGGGGFGGGGGAAPLPRNDGGGGAASSLTSNGGSLGGSGGGGGGGGGFPGGGGGYGGNGNGEGKGKFDLKDFLPFGKLDPKQKVAGLQPNAAGGVTGANGLSNWEKVSRRMQVIRGKLQR